MTDKEPSNVARPSFRLFLDLRFGSFLIGRLLSTTGVWSYNAATVIVMWELSRSSLLVGLVSVAQFGPQFLLGFWSGSLADRGDRRLQIFAGRFLIFAGSGLMAGLLQFPIVPGHLLQQSVLLCALIVGAGFAVGVPAMHAVVPDLVRPSELAQAVSLNTLPMSIGRTVGPAIAATIIVMFGPVPAILLGAVSNLLFGVIALIVVPADRISLSTAGSIFDGINELLRNRITRALLLGVAAVGFGSDPAITLAPAIAERSGSGAGAVGALMAAFGGGALTLFLVLRRTQNYIGLLRSTTAGLSLMAFGTAILAAPIPLLYCLFAFAVSGAGMTLALTSATTLIHEGVAKEFRGRAMALWSMGFVGARPLAATVNGFLAQWASLMTSLIVVSLLVVAAALMVHIVRRRDIGMS